MRTIDRDTAASTRDGAPMNGSHGGRHDAGHVRVAVIGIGFVGLSLAHALREAGIEDWVMLERSGQVGGVWRDNTYPGIACDVPSHLYSLSFAPNPDWERTYSSGRQIWEYEQRVASELRIEERTRFGEELLDARWDHERSVWRLRTTSLELTAEVVIDGTGPIAEPKLPTISGLDRFRGTLFHSARWNHQQPLAGKRVAVIGTGCSAIQIVPAIQPHVGQMTVFQRTAGWVLPRFDRDVTALERRLFRAVPALQKLPRAGQYLYRDLLFLQIMHRRSVRVALEALAKAFIRRSIRDPELRAKVTPNFELGCKRLMISNDWYPALDQPNVHVETAAITEVRAQSILTADGAEHPVDAIVLATGYHTNDPPAAQIFHGRDGRTLADTWGDSPRAYRGLTTVNFPNLFRIGGPGTATGHISHILAIESGTRYVLDALKTMGAQGVAAVEVTEDAQARYARWLREHVKDTVWATGGCTSWYLDRAGQPSIAWPCSAWRYRRITRRFDPAAYHYTPRTTPGADNGRPTDDTRLVATQAATDSQIAASAARS